MNTLLKELVPLVTKLIVTLLVAYMVFTGCLSGSLLAPVIEAVGHAL
ncbi:hypothetical protein [Yersinia enterocolitica]|nr:hypothetical protein [Yersinia enterocolitica]MCE3066865.1 hypothetical protein [Yersinia enterocolitica]